MIIEKQCLELFDGTQLDNCYFLVEKEHYDITLTRAIIGITKNSRIQYISAGDPKSINYFFLLDDGTVYGSIYLNKNLTYLKKNLNIVKKIEFPKKVKKIATNKFSSGAAFILEDNSVYALGRNWGNMFCMEEQYGDNLYYDPPIKINGVENVKQVEFYTQYVSYDMFENNISNWYCCLFLLYDGTVMVSGLNTRAPIYIGKNNPGPYLIPNVNNVKQIDPNNGRQFVLENGNILEFGMVRYVVWRNNAPKYGYECVWEPIIYTPTRMNYIYNVDKILPNSVCGGSSMHTQTFYMKSDKIYKNCTDGNIYDYYKYKTTKYPIRCCEEFEDFIQHNMNRHYHLTKNGEITADTKKVYYPETEDDMCVALTAYERIDDELTFKPLLKDQLYFGFEI